MKKYLVSLLIAAVALTGCVSSTAPAEPTSKQQTIANAVEDAIAIGLVPVLANNPDYLETAQVVAVALGAVNGDQITPEGVQTFLNQFDLAPEDARVIAGVVNAAWATYTKRYAAQVNASVRPDVKLFLGAVSNGIRSAVAATPRHG